MAGAIKTMGSLPPGAMELDGRVGCQLGHREAYGEEATGSGTDMEIVGQGVVEDALEPSWCSPTPPGSNAR